MIDSTVKKKSRWRQKLILLASTCLLIALAVAAGEIYCRYFTRINFLDNSRGMFAAGKFGESYGNTANFRGISFGEEFATDENGFRVDPNVKENAADAAPAILIVGDSVTFGPAVEESRTAAGIVRRRAAPNYKIYNASAIGYDTFDYRNAVFSIIENKPQIKTVLLFFCLNDVNDLSAQQIRKQTNSSPVDEEDQTSLIQKVNDFLRSRSKLYLWLKNSLRDTQKIYFENDLSQYRKGNEYVNQSLAPLAGIKKTLDAKNIRLEVFILPYEAQTRTDVTDADLLPQRMIDVYLSKNAVSFHDLTAEFRRQSSPNRLFLYGDPMHLSEAGNLLTANAVCAELKDVCKIN